MARRPVFESCMFCGQLPCACIKAPKAKAVPKPRKTAAPKPEPFTGPPKCSWCTPEERAAGMPCACNAPAPVAALPDDPPMPPPTRKAAVRAAMRAHVSSPAPVAPAPEPVISDPVMEDAIRALAPILHPVERRRHDAVLNSPSAVRQRAAAWRNKIRGIA